MPKALGIIIPVAVLGTLLLGVGGLYLSILDRTPSPYQDQGLNNDQVLRRQLVRSFKDTKENKKIEYKIDQDSLNQIFLNANESIKGSAAGDYIGNIYTEIKDNNYKFYVEADAKIIKTRIILDTTLSDDNENYFFQINSINAGHFPAYGILKATGVLRSLPLDSVFANVGLNMKFDAEKGVITYSKADVEKDLIKMMSSNTDDLLEGALNTMDLKFAFDAGINATGDLSELIENPKVSDSRVDGPHYSNYKAYTDSISKTVNGYVEKIKAGADEDSLKAFLDESFGALKSIKAKDKEVNQVIKERIMATPVTAFTGSGYNKEVSHITEGELDEILLTTGILGKNYVFHFNEEVAYIVVDSFYTDIFTDDHGDSFINYTLGINVNGLETRAIIETKCSPIDNSFSADFVISNIYFGSKKAEDKFATVVKNFFDDALSSMDDASWMSHERGSNSMTINFDKLVQNDDALVTYQDIFYNAGGTRSFLISNNGINESGVLSIRFAR